MVSGRLRPCRSFALTVLVASTGGLVFGTLMMLLDELS
jgi:hypothetical protein